MKIDITNSDGTKTVEVPHPEHIQQPLIQTIVNELRGVGVCPSTGESGIRTTKVMTEITRKDGQ